MEVAIELVGSKVTEVARDEAKGDPVRLRAL